MTIARLECVQLCSHLAMLQIQATAYGVFLHRGSYLRGVFNIIDVMVTVCTLVPIVVYLAHRPAQIE